MIPKRRRREKMGVRQSMEIRSQGHRQWVCGHVCLIDGKHGHVCLGKMHPHHVRKGTHTGMSQTPDDSEVVPLCAAGHAEVHNGHDTFEAKYGLDLSRIAAELWAKSPHGRRFRAARQEPAA